MDSSSGHTYEQTSVDFDSSRFSWIASLYYVWPSKIYSNSFKRWGGSSSMSWQYSHLLVGNTKIRLLTHNTRTTERLQKGFNVGNIVIFS